MKAAVNCTSVLDMHSKKERRKEQRAKIKVKSAIFCIALSSTFLLLSALSAVPCAAIRDRVAAYVDNIAITLSDLEVRYEETARVSPNITREEVLNTMINRTLMLRQARKMRLEALSEDQLLKEYIDLKVKAFIRIKDEEVKEFYNKHIGDFQGKEFEVVRDEIENYLIENELNQRLKTHIGDLRENACVQMQLNKEVQR